MSLAEVRTFTMQARSANLPPTNEAIHKSTAPGHNARLYAAKTSKA